MRRRRGSKGEQNPSSVPVSPGDRDQGPGTRDHFLVLHSAVSLQFGDFPAAVWVQNRYKIRPEPEKVVPTRTAQWFHWFLWTGTSQTQFVQQGELWSPAEPKLHYKIFILISTFQEQKQKKLFSINYKNDNFLSQIRCCKIKIPHSFYFVLTWILNDFWQKSDERSRVDGESLCTKIRLFT